MRSKKIFSLIEEKRTDSEISDLGNVLRTSRKLAPAKNFFAVDLYELLVRDKSHNYEIAAYLVA